MFSKTTNSLMQLFALVNRVDGRIKLQKIVYILQEKNVGEFELEYKYALYGPYSEDLQIEIENLVKLGFLKEEASNEGYSYQLRNDFPVRIVPADGIELNKELIFDLMAKEYQLLEVTSTIYYLKSHRYGERETIEKKLKLLKPTLEDKIPNAFELYSFIEHVPIV